MLSPRYVKVESFPCGVLLIEADSSGSAYFKFLKNELLNNLGGGPAQEDPYCVYWQGKAFVPLPIQSNSGVFK